MRKFESLQKGESRAQSADSAEALTTNLDLLIFFLAIYTSREK